MTTYQYTDVVPDPRRPWDHSRSTALRVVLLVALSGVFGWGATSFTGLSGFLGWYVGLGFAMPVVAFVGSVRHGWNLASDRIATALISVAFAAVTIPWVSILLTVIRKGMKAFHANYITDDMRITPSSDALQYGGVAHAIIGTLIMVLVASLIAVPLGILAAVYIVEIRGRFANLVRFLTQAMSGVPSIVAGLFVYSTIVIFFRSFSAIAGALSLVILMLPTVARTSEEVLKIVPAELRSASYALGATQFRTTFRVVVPTVSSGLVTAAVLGVARVVGETAPLLLTASYFTAKSFNITEPIGSLPIYIFSSLGIGDANATARAWGGSLVLLVVVLILFVFARIISSRLSRRK
jgi:phosphate transport system permease protein